MENQKFADQLIPVAVADAEHPDNVFPRGAWEQEGRGA